MFTYVTFYNIMCINLQIFNCTKVPFIHLHKIAIIIIFIIIFKIQ